MRHLDNAQLIDYFSERWTPDQQRSVELHLSECDECASRARELYLGLYVFDQWNTERHREFIPETHYSNH